MPITAAGAVLAIVVGFVAVKLTTGTAAAASESPAPQSVVSQVTTVPAAVLARVRGGGTVTPLQPVKAPGPVLTAAGKPAIVFVSEESCPFCAAERWPLVVALSHFGTWSHLGATRSSATDVFPNTATLSWAPGMSRPAGNGRPGHRDQVRSNRSRFMTLSHAATKSPTNFSFASSHA